MNDASVGPLRAWMNRVLQHRYLKSGDKCLSIDAVKDYGMNTFSTEMYARSCSWS